MTATYNALTTEKQNELKSLILEIVRERGRVYLSDLSGYVRTTCLIKFGYDFDYTDFVNNSHAAIWELEKTHLTIERTLKQSFAYEPNF